MKQLLFLTFFLYVHGTLAINCDVEPKTTEAVLRKKLLCSKYDKSERPVKNHTIPVLVDMHMIMQNFNFEDNLQKLYINVWLLLLWKDEYLNWNPMEYDGIIELIIESDDIWVPDMLPYSAYYSNNLDTACTTPKCLLESTGKIKCVPACEYHTLCRSDYTNWPFDRQNCSIRFGMWAEHSKEIDFVANETSFASEETNSHNEWKILSMSVQKYDSPLPEKNTTYPSLIYNYILERHSGSHCAVVLTPAFVMVAINLIALWLKCYSLDRMLLLGANLFIHFLFIENLYWMIPYNGSTTPSFLLFFRDSLVLTSCILYATVFLKYVFFSDKEAPLAIRGLLVSIASNRLAQKLFSADTDEDDSSHNAIENDRANERSAEEITEDTVILVDGNPNEPEKINGTRKLCRMVAVVCDKLLFVGITNTGLNAEVFRGSDETARSSELVLKRVCSDEVKMLTSLMAIPMAVNRLRDLDRRLAKDLELRRRLNEQIESFEQKEYVRKVSVDELKNINPQRALYLRLEIVSMSIPKKPDKIRMVWDATAKAGGVSFNDMLLKGPHPLVPLIEVLLQFRESIIDVRAYPDSNINSDHYIRYRRLPQYDLARLEQAGIAETTRYLS
ncbi:acetylcholine receptor subunit alpha-like [Sabethes cyaneus]|uniref:acetylcholine receptor subunit alpha-like n=1 Tax=Sabethes cyaneus TaxID=53552 RepID=UPI00237E67F8|nr:acetylcholine receptor subunit alpha-like [Sabethes cyaneus]